MRCVAPWATIHINASHLIGPCCRWPQSHKYIVPASASVPEVFNCQQAQDCRAQVASASPVSPCHLCSDWIAASVGTQAKHVEANWSMLDYGNGPSPEFEKNRALILGAIESRSTRLDGIPIKWNLNPSWTCNLRCIICARNRMIQDGKRSQDIPQHYLDYVIDHHKAIAYVAVSGGEPFAAEKPLNFLKRCAEVRSHFCVKITTNGTCTDFDLLQALNLSMIKVSFDGGSAEALEAQRVGADFYDIVSNMARLKEMERSGKMSGQVTAHGVVSNITIETLPDQVAMFESLDIPLTLAAVESGEAHLALGKNVGPAFGEKFALLQEAAEKATGRTKNDILHIINALEASVEIPEESSRRPRFVPTEFFNKDKAKIIDLALSDTYPPVQTLADLGGIWRVEGDYALYAMGKYCLDEAIIIDRCVTETAKARIAEWPKVRIHEGEFNDPASVSEANGSECLLMFDVLLHQVNPNWDDLLRLYCKDAKVACIYNPQWIGGKTVRLIKLGKERYFQNVPYSSDDPMYETLFDGGTQEERDRSAIWQWGITDNDLVAVMRSLGFGQIYGRDCGQFAKLLQFRRKAFVFSR